VSYLTWLVIIGTSLLGSTAGVLGSFAVLRRRALVGDLVSHAALPGLCLAFLVLGGRHFAGMLGGALVTGVAGVALIALLCRWTRTKEDAALGIVLSTFFGAGIMLSSIIQNMAGEGSKAGLESYIYGQAAGMIRQDLTMMGSLALVTVVGLPAVGVVLMAAMLILPGAAARFWTDHLGRMLVLSGVIGALAGTAGTLVSAGVVKSWLGFDLFGFGDEPGNFPTGPTIVLCGTAIFVFSVLFAPQRGVLARLSADWRLRRKTAAENLLRTLYEQSESRLPDRPAVSIDQLRRMRAWSRLGAARLVRRAAGRGRIERVPGGVRLPEAGLGAARRLARLHRLWELFLVEGASIAPDHVDRDADSIEHVLTPRILAELEARLAARAQIEPAAAVPGSPHDLASPAPPGGIAHG